MLKSHFILFALLCFALICLASYFFVLSLRIPSPFGSKAKQSKAVTRKEGERKDEKRREKSSDKRNTSPLLFLYWLCFNL